MKSCSKCKEEKSDDQYQLSKNGKPGGQCRSCKTQYMKMHRLKRGIRPKVFSRIEDEKKLCMECRTMLKLEMFSPSTRGLGGVSSYCKPCTAAKPKDPEKVRAATARYRETNREKYLANHRLTQFYRKTRIKAVTDSTVTTEFLESLYSTEICVYCEQFTEEHLRTADHVIPLIKGGIHSASNLVMACFTCNSSKGQLTKEEFIKRLKNDHRNQSKSN